MVFQIGPSNNKMTVTGTVMQRRWCCFVKDSCFVCRSSGTSSPFHWISTDWGLLLGNPPASWSFILLSCIMDNCIYYSRLDLCFHQGKHTDPFTHHQAIFKKSWAADPAAAQGSSRPGQVGSLWLLLTRDGWLTPLSRMRIVQGCEMQKEVADRLGTCI